MWRTYLQQVKEANDLENLSKMEIVEKYKEGLNNNIYKYLHSLCIGRVADPYPGILGGSGPL